MVTWKAAEGLEVQDLKITDNTGWPIINRIQTHGNINGLTFPHVTHIVRLGWVSDGKLCNTDKQPLVLASKRTLIISETFMYLYIYTYRLCGLVAAPGLENRD